MKVVILGAGISGFSVYLFLKKHLTFHGLWNDDVSVVIYEAYDIHKLTANVTPLREAGSDEPVFTPVAVGSALGISQNGLKVLRRLDEDGTLLDKVKSRGNPISRWRMSNARGWTLADIRSTPVSKDTNTLDGQSGSDVGDLTVMIARQEIWEVLRDEALKDERVTVVVCKKVNHVVIGDLTTRSTIQFDDGTSDEADLVVGADGLRSVLRRAIFESKESQAQQEQQQQPSGTWSTWLGLRFSNNSASAIDYVTPQFEGLVSFGGFLPTKELESVGDFDSKTMNFVFGPNGFFGFGCISSNSRISEISVQSSEVRKGGVSAWWSSFSSPVPYPYRHPVRSTNSATSEAAYVFEGKRGLDDLLVRHRSWSNPAIHKILQYATQTGLAPANFYPTWTTPELPRWQQNGVAILIGDAAHTLQTTSGQGVSQALEDAEALAMLLSHYVAQGKDRDSKDMTRTGMTAEVRTATATALEKFESLRKPRVHAIHERSQKMANKKLDMGFVQEMIMYFAIWILTFFHDTFNDTLVDYDLPGEVAKIIAKDRV